MFLRKKKKIEREKMREKTFFVSVWLKGGEEKNWWSSIVFSLGPPNFLSPNWGKTRENKNGQTWKKKAKSC